MNAVGLEWMAVETEELEMMLDLLGVEASEPLDSELMRDLKALGTHFGIDVEAL